jgi:MFS family permease
MVWWRSSSRMLSDASFGLLGLRNSVAGLCQSRAISLLLEPILTLCSMQSSLSFVNISILICALSTSFKMTIAGRVIGGLSSAGGSVTLGMVADMFSPEEQQHAVRDHISTSTYPG